MSDEFNYDEALTILAGLMKAKASAVEIKAIVKELVDSAVADEREACAKIAEAAHAYWCDKAPASVDLAAALDIAAAIRSRGEKA